jgi:hypothetical protein
VSERCGGLGFVDTDLLSLRVSLSFVRLGQCPDRCPSPAMFLS